MAATQKEFNFFEKQLQEVAQKVNKHSYKKLLCTAFVFSLVASLVPSICYYGHNYITLSQIKKEQTLKEEAEKQKVLVENSRERAQISLKKNQEQYYHRIQKISPEKFAQFVAYLKRHQSLYDSRFELMSMALMTAQQENRKQSLDALGESATLNKMISSYKNESSKLLLKISGIYENINKTEIVSYSLEDLKLFEEVYNQYKLGIVLTNSVIENRFDTYLFAKNQGNVDYNLKNNLLIKYKELEQKTIHYIIENK